MVDFVTHHDFALIDSNRTREISLLIQIVAATVGTSYLLIFVPNVETITIGVFFMGFTFKTKFGFKTMLTTLIVWEMIATASYGFSMIAFPFKFLAWLLFFFAAKLAQKVNLNGNLEFAAIGSFCTVLWDAVATLSTAMVLSKTPEEFTAVYIASLILGIPFTIVHVATNTYLFFMFPYLLRSVVPHLRNKFPSLVEVSLNDEKE